MEFTKWESIYFFVQDIFFYWFEESLRKLFRRVSSSSCSMKLIANCFHYIFIAVKLYPCIVKHIWILILQLFKLFNAILRIACTAICHEYKNHFKFVDVSCWYFCCQEEWWIEIGAATIVGNILSNLFSILIFNKNWCSITKFNNRKPTNILRIGEPYFIKGLT